MKDYRVKEIFRNLLAIATGAIIAFLLFAFFSLFGYALLSISGTWYGYVVMILIYLMTTGIAGYVTAIISTRKDIFNVIITGLVLILMLLINNNFSFDSTIEEWLIFYCILLLTFAGGLLGIRSKKKKALKDRKASHSGTAEQ